MGDAAHRQLAAGANYRRFAGVIVGLAVLVAVGATDTDFSAQRSAEPAAEQAQTVSLIPPVTTAQKPNFAELGPAGEAETFADQALPSDRPVPQPDPDRPAGAAADDTAAADPSSPPALSAPQPGQSADAPQLSVAPG